MILLISIIVYLIQIVSLICLPIIVVKIIHKPDMTSEVATRYVIICTRSIYTAYTVYLLSNVDMKNMGSVMVMMATLSWTIMMNDHIYLRGLSQYLLHILVITLSIILIALSWYQFRDEIHCMNFCELMLLPKNILQYKLFRVTKSILQVE